MIYWVMGGTAIGKKTFIRYVQKNNPEWLEINGQIQPLWIADGDMPMEDILNHHSEHTALMIRWQWGRENRLVEIAKKTKLHQKIFLLVARPEDQAKRVLKREGEQKWDAYMLNGEGREIYGLANGLSLALRLPLVHINTTVGFKPGDLE